MLPHSQPRRFPILAALVLLLALAVFASRTHSDGPAVVGGETQASEASSSRQSPQDLDVDRSPVDLVLGPDETWLATANRTSDSVSLVRVADGAVLDEVRVGRRPADIALCPDGRHLLVSGSDSGDVRILQVAGDELQEVGIVEVGFEPYGIAVAPTKAHNPHPPSPRAAPRGIAPRGIAPRGIAPRGIAYVALFAADQVAVLDLQQQALVDRIDVGRWPRYLALSPDGRRLAVGTSGDHGVTVVDTSDRKRLYIERFGGMNLGHMQVSRDGSYVYFPWMIYRANPISRSNIRQGWVLASRFARVRLDGKARREAISLDPRGEAVADPHGLGLTSDEQHAVVSASGTHELLVYRLPGLPFVDYGGPGDHIDPDLLSDRDRFYRIPLGGRPMGLEIAGDDRTVYVANYLKNAVQVVDLDRRECVRTISLGGPESPSLARRGETIFYDARRSLDQWYSCHSCHYDGGTNSDVTDTFNDGSPFTAKTVLPLYNVEQTGPWTWHGWQKDLRAGLRKSLTETMLGPEPTDDDLDALSAFLKTLQRPPNPFQQKDGNLSSAAQRGREIFRGLTAGCSQCHSGPLLTDGEIHDVGTGELSDRYDGFNTPSLRGVYRRVRLLHDGRARSLKELLTGPHDPAKVTAGGSLSEQQLADLIAYLKTL